MSLTIRCPNPDCGQNYSVREESLGSRTTCKKCGTGFTVEMKADETGVRNPPASHAPPASGHSRQVEEPQKMAAAAKPVPAAGGPPAKKIGPYAVRRRLGEGGMGEVWLAHDPSLDRNVAIKTLPPRFAANQDRLKRFLREARLAAKLHHTNTVTVYQVGQEGSLVYIAMEYVDGQSLDNAVSEGRPMPWQEATRATRDAAAGLEAAHKLGLVHRDIKPANLMRTRDGVTKVADFGLARSQFAESRMTQEGSVLGTPAYMSPEQWQGGQVDGRSDLYSLACAYYCLLAGQDPFGDAAPGALGYMHCHEPVRDPRRFSPGLPDAVCRILARGLEKKPEERYQSAGELLAELETLLASPEKSLTVRATWQQLQPSSAAAGSAASRGGAPTLLARAKTAVVQGLSALAAVGRGGLSWKWLAAGLGAAAVGLLLGIVFLIRTGNGTVKIELSDPKAQVEVKVDGNVIDIAGLKEPLRLKAGEHGLLVTSGDYQSVSESFTVRRGEEEVVRVTLEPKPAGPRPPVKVAGKPQDSARPTEPAGSASAVGKTSPNDLTAKLEEISVELGGGLKMEMVLIPPGEFMMGSPDSDKDARADEKPQHRVRITKPFYLGKYPVMQEQWQAVMDDVVDNNPSEFKGAKNPVERVSWDDCQVFLGRLNAKSSAGGGKFHLPTEAQWEYACRAGSTGKYCFGDDGFALRDYAWFGANSRDTSHPVGGKKSNAWGLYDMHGNVWQWCADCYGSKYGADLPTDDPTGPATGLNHVSRGSFWLSFASNCRSAARHVGFPGGRGVGFRMARTYDGATLEPKVKPAKPQQTKAGEAAIAPKPEPTKPQLPAPAVTGLKEETNSIGMKMLLVPAGEFTMGSNDSVMDAEKPAHRVHITKPFYLGQFKVTVGQYRKFAEATNHTDASWKTAFPSQTDEHPVVNVSWDDATAFCKWLSAKEAKTYRLPTEAEWEYACRAGSTTKYWFGENANELGDYAWYSNNSGGMTHPVGRKKPSAWGLYDMHGNAREWCADWYDVRYYDSSPSEDPKGPLSGSDRVLRGGSWGSDASMTGSLARCGNEPDDRITHSGFRVARTP